METKLDPETCESSELKVFIYEGEEQVLEKVLQNPNLTPHQVVLIFENTNRNRSYIFFFHLCSDIDFTFHEFYSLS